MVDDPAHETGAVKGSAGIGAAPHIRIAQVFLGLPEHGGKLFVLHGLRRHSVVQIVLPARSIGVFPLREQVWPVAQSCHIHRIHTDLILIHQIDRQVGQVKVGECHIADVIIVGNLHLILVVLGAGLAGLRVSVGMGSRPGLRPVAGLLLHPLGEGVLPLKEHGKRPLHLRQRPFPLIVGGKQGDQHIRVMPDLVQLIMVLVIAAVQAFIVVKLILKVSLHPGIIGLRPQHIRIPAGVGGTGHAGHPALEQHGQGRKAVHKNTHHQEQGDHHQKSFAVTPDKSGGFFRFFSCFFGSPSRIPGVFYGLCGIFPCPGSGILLFDGLFLLPPGEGIAGNLGIFRKALVVQCFYIGLFQPFFCPGSGPVGFQLVASVALL